MKKFLSSLLLALTVIVTAGPAHADDSCKNLASGFVKGTLSVDGGISAINTRATSQFIPVSPGETYTVSVNGDNFVVFEWVKYRQDKSFIGYGPTINAVVTTLTIPDGVYFIRYSIRKSDNATFGLNDFTSQFEKGSTATAYQPYNPLCATCDGTVNESPNLFDGNPVVISQGTWQDGRYVGTPISSVEWTIWTVNTAANQSTRYVFSRTHTGEVLSQTVTKTPDWDSVKIGSTNNGADNYIRIDASGLENGVDYTISFRTIEIGNPSENKGTTFDSVQIERGTTATPYQLYGYYCADTIKIATTAYNAARFSPVQTDLNNAVATIREIVTKTINQTAAIASLQADKQTRPEEQCPAGKKCLLVETEENGVIVPHWFPIIEAPENTE